MNCFGFIVMWKKCFGLIGLVGMMYGRNGYLFGSFLVLILLSLICSSKLCMVLMLLGVCLCWCIFWLKIIICLNCVFIVW